MKDYQVIRIFVKSDSSRSNSIELFDDYFSAQQRFYNIIASDLANTEVVYQGAYIISKEGLMLDGKVFDRSSSEV